MNRRSFLTALAALPAFALLARFLKAPPTEDELCLRQLRFFYDTMKLHRGEAPAAIFVHPDKMLRLARVFDIEPKWNEFECPWGGDICGTPNVNLNDIDISCRGSAVIYRFGWDNFSYSRSDPKDFYKQGFHTGHLKAHFLDLPNSRRWCRNKMWSQTTSKSWNVGRS